MVCLYLISDSEIEERLLGYNYAYLFHHHQERKGGKDRVCTDLFSEDDDDILHWCESWVIKLVVIKVYASGDESVY